MCASQCHEGHNIIKDQSNDICKCNHQHPKIKIFSSIFKREALTDPQKKFLLLCARIHPNLSDDELFEKLEKSNSEEIDKRIRSYEMCISDQA